MQIFTSITIRPDAVKRLLSRQSPQSTWR